MGNKKPYSIVFDRLIPDEVFAHCVPQDGIHKAELINNYLEIARTCLYQANAHLSKSKIRKPLTTKVVKIIEDINCVIHDSKRRR